MKHHFTNRIGWDGIRADQQIEISTINVGDGELPVAWFSSNPTWDYSARANVRLTLDVNGQIKHYKLSFGELCNGLVVPKFEINIPPTELFRISVEDDIAPMTWAEYKAASNTPAEVLLMMEQEQGVNPNEWYASTVHILHEQCQGVYQWDMVAGNWQVMLDPWVQ